MKIQLLYCILLLCGTISCSEKIDPIVEDYIDVSIPSYIPEVTTLKDVPVKGIELGRQLFFDKNLSSNKKISCSSCHQQQYAFGDTESLNSAGVSGQQLARHSPSLFNLAWHKGYFWDGGAPDLGSQLLGPLLSEHEMNGRFDSVISYLNSEPKYRTLFVETFQEDDINSKKILKVFKWYQLTLTSFNSKYDTFLEQNDSSILSNTELKGLEIYESQCNTCHTLPLGSSYEYANNEIDNQFDYPFEDERLGRYRITENIDDLGKYKIPSLRNLSFTAPYMHDGRFQTLDDVLQHYHKLETINNIDINLEEHQLKHLKTFLHTLNDSSFVEI